MNARQFPKGLVRQLFQLQKNRTFDALPYPIQNVVIDRDRLAALRPLVLDTVHTMPAYLIKPEVLTLLDAEKDPRYRLILDLMWTTGARISEVLALTPASFVDNAPYGFGVILKTLKQRPGRPSKAALQRSPKRYVPIVDPVVKDRIECYLEMGGFGSRTSCLRLPDKPSIDVFMRRSKRTAARRSKLLATAYATVSQSICCCTGGR